MATLAELFRQRYARQHAIPDSLPERMAVVQAQHRSNRASARAAGVDERTWRRWLTGATRPRPVTAARLATAAQQVRAAGIRFNFASITVRQQEGRRQRTRTIGARGLNWSPAANDAVREQLALADWQGAARAWLDGVRDQEYRDLLNDMMEVDGPAADDDYVMTPMGFTA